MRPEILFPLYAPIASLKGVGPRVAPLLEKLAGPIVRDVAFLKPHSLVRRTPATVSTAIDGQVMTFEVTIAGVERPRGPAQPWRVRAFDQTGFISLVFFGGVGSSLEQRHPANARRLVSGKVEQFRDEWQIVHPDYLLAADKAGEIPDIEPIYPATQGLPARTVRRFVGEALERTPELPEWQDAAWLARERFPTFRAALARLHAPEIEADLSPASPHYRRLAYDELLAQQLAMAQRRAERRRGSTAISSGKPAPRSCYWRAWRCWSRDFGHGSRKWRLRSPIGRVRDRPAWNASGCSGRPELAFCWVWCGAHVSDRHLALRRCSRRRAEISGRWLRPWPRSGPASPRCFSCWRSRPGACWVAGGVDCVSRAVRASRCLVACSRSWAF